MKMNKIVVLMVSGGLAFSLMTGCGGGGSDDSTTTPTVPTVGGVTPTKVNDFLGDMADEMGCAYTEVATSLSTKTDATDSFDTVDLIKKIIVSGKNITEVAEASTIAATSPGTCGGSLTLPDDLLTTLTGTIIADNYCMSAEDIGSETTLNGSLAIASDEAAGTISISTPTPLTIVSSSPETGNPVSVTIDLASAVITINEDESMNIFMTSLVITHNDTNKVYTITNFTGEMVGDTLTFDGTLNNPEVDGAVNVVGSCNTTTGQCTITATDQGGVEVKLNTTSTEGVFEASVDDALVGTMDCSTVDIPTTVPTI